MEAFSVLRIVSSAISAKYIAMRVSAVSIAIFAACFSVFANLLENSLRTFSDIAGYFKMNC